MPPFKESNAGGVNEGRKSFRELVLADVNAFVKSGYGRAQYSAEVRGSTIGSEKEREAMDIVAREIFGRDYLDIVTLAKMVEYMVDVYNQGIAHLLMRTRDRQRSEEDALYGNLRKKILSVLRSFTPQSPEEVAAFKHLYYLIRPYDYNPSLAQKTYWRLKYPQSSTEGDVPMDMPNEKLVAYIKKQLPNIV